MSYHLMLVTKPHTACLQIVKVVVPTKKADRTHADYGFVHFEERQAAVTLVEAAERAQDPLILKFPEGTENVLQVCSRPGCMKPSLQGLFAGFPVSAVGLSGRC